MLMLVHPPSFYLDASYKLSMFTAALKHSPTHRKPSSGGVQKDGADEKPSENATSAVGKSCQWLTSNCTTSCQ